jgi:hypothetical protein
MVPPSTPAALSVPALLAIGQAGEDTALVYLLLALAGIAALGGLVVLLISRYARQEGTTRGPIPVPLEGATPPRQIRERPRRPEDAPLPVVLPDPPPLPNQAAAPRGEPEKPRTTEQECPLTPPPS